jgi:outer membrane protein OmpA-like peptidoglycan-associated protein
VPSVTALGKALTNPELKGSTFVLAGHTDAKGSIPANQDLSEKRADSIKHYLVDHFKIPASTLVTVGYGKTKLTKAREKVASLQSSAGRFRCRCSIRSIGRATTSTPTV